MGLLKKYDPKEVVATWDGIELTSGIVKGTFISVTRNESTASLNKGGDGGSTMVIGHDKSGVAEITLRAASDTNERLSTVMDLDESDPSQKRVGVFEVRDFNGTTLVRDPEAFLTGPPAYEAGVEESERAWALALPDVKIHNGSNNQAASVASAGNV